MHVDHKTFTLLPSVEICALSSVSSYGQRPRVAGLFQSVHLKLCKGFLRNFYHVTESDDDEEEFSLNDPSVHEGHLHQNGILTLIGIETAKKISHIVKSKQHNKCMGFKAKSTSRLKILK